jgi:hypothetical membrane protein
MRRLSLTSFAGILVILAYFGLSVASYLHYPGGFNPRDNWLSDLGNAALNPSGALLYRIGSVLTGLLIADLFIGLRAAWHGISGKAKSFFLISQVFGVISAVALVMTGVFSEGQHASHSLWSGVLFISFGTAVLFSGWAFLRYPGGSRKFSYFTFALTAVDWVMGIFNKTHFLEWLLVALMLIYVGTLSWRMAWIASRR